MKKYLCLPLIAAFIGTAHGQQFVHDPLAFIEQASQTALLLDVVSSQITMVEEAYKEAERQVKFVTQFPARIFNTTVGYIEDQIEAIERIGENVQSLVLTVGDSFVDAEDFFLTEEDYSEWFNPNLSPEERKALVDRDIERATWFRDLNRRTAMESHLLKQELKEKIIAGHERIGTILENIAGSDSIIAQTQAANQVASESYQVLASIAQSTATMADAITRQIVADEERKHMADELDQTDLFKPCPDGYMRDPISLDCVEIPRKRVKEILEEGMVDSVEDTAIYRQNREMLRRAREGR